MKWMVSVLFLFGLIFFPSCKKKSSPKIGLKPGSASGKKAPVLPKNRGLNVDIDPVRMDSHRRTALVIGNASYKNPLSNPLHDASDMAKSLKSVGFQVILRTDVTRRQMRMAIRKFGNELKKGGVGLFYYAGHGVQVKGRNYLIPIGAEVSNEDEVVDEAVSAGAVLRKMETAGNRMNLVILDACRNNPFRNSFRSVNRGLARMDAPSGTLVVYATAPGKRAADGIGRNGLFTSYFLKYMKVPDLEIGKLLRCVRIKVKKATSGVQIPWESSSLEGDFYFSRSKTAPFVPHNEDSFSLGALQKWGKYAANMKKAYRQVVSFHKSDASIEIKILAWKKFLSKFSEDNPLTKEDDRLRKRVKEAISSLLAEKVRADETANKFEEERRKAEAKRRKLEKWSARLKAMTLAYKSALLIQKGGYTLDIKMGAWWDFLAKHSEDNPYSDEDETMRQNGRGYLAVLDAKKRAKPKKAKDDTYEPNNFLSQASSISTGKTGRLVLKKGDVDFYKISVNQLSKITASIDFNQKKGDLELAFLDERGKELGKSTTSNSTETVSIETSSPVYIKVYGYNGAGNKYTISVALQKINKPKGILHYTFDKNHDGKIYDKIGKNHLTIRNGGSMISALSKQGMGSFRMVGWYGSVQPQAEIFKLVGIPHTYDITITFWIRFQTFTYRNTTVRLWGIGQNISESGDKVLARELRFSHSDSGYSFGVIAGKTVQRRFPVHSMKANQWYHIAVVTAKRKIALYLNGSLLKASPSKNTVDCVPLRGGGLLLGTDRNISSAGQVLNAYIDDFWVYASALSQKTIKNLANK